MSWTIISVIAACGIIAFCTAKITKKDDGPVEETMEEVIKNVSNGKIDVDVTPSSPEDEHRSK